MSRQQQFLMLVQTAAARQFSDLTVQADTSAAASATEEARYDVLLELLQKLHERGGFDWRFVPSATGGATTASHSHAAGTLAGPSHTHILYTSEENVEHVALGTYYGLTNTSTASGGTGSVTGNTATSAPSILPPYYGLYYIMKVA